MSQQDFDELWDYEHPGNTEAAFRARVSAAESGADRSYYVQLMTQIARAQGLQRNFDDAHMTLDAVEPQLSDEQVVPRVRYLLERGRVFNSSGRPDAARPFFLRAWELSEPDPDAAFFAVDAAHMLAIAAPSFAEGVAWNTRALARAERATDPKARDWCGSLYNNLGWSHHEQGEFEEALRYFRSALQWQEAHGTGRQIRVARWAVGRSLRSLGRFDDALSVQEALLEEWHASGEQQAGFVSEELAECLLALGRVEQSRPYFAEAHALLGRDPWLVAQEPERLTRLRQLSMPA
jgi:tetratricopeptide (TPR) repeat protein